MEELSKDLLRQFVYMDEKVNLYAPDGSFEIPLSITAAKLYSPVIKAALESPLSINEDGRTTDEKTVSKEGKKHQQVYSSFRRIKVVGFNHETVQIFVRCLQGQLDTNEIKAFDWSKVLGLLKMCHFYGVDHMFEVYLEHGKNLIQQNNVVQAIEFMETYGYQQPWCDCITQQLLSYPNIFNTQDWKDSIKKFPQTQSQVQYWYIKKKLGYG